LCLSETLEDKALKTLMRTMSLGIRFPKEYESWENRRSEIEKRFQKTLAERQAEIDQKIEQASGDIQATVREAVIDAILKAFP
jgi:DNA-binding transcriptional MerR regulator